MTDKEILILANEILSSDAAFDSDCVLMDELQKRPVTFREKTLADIITKLYKLIHPAVSKCRHDDWGKESQDIMKESL